MTAESLAGRLRSEITQHGSMAVSDYVEAALYDPEEGFYSVAGRAGRRGDFLTSPEVGPLFGAVIARVIDGVWIAAGRPEEFRVVEYGAGPGTLCRAVLAAEPGCAVTGSLEWVMVEVSVAQRADHPTGPNCRSVADDSEIDGANFLLANEFFDNLPFDIVAHRAEGWVERRVALHDDVFVLVDGQTAAVPAGAEGLPPGAELPVHSHLAPWLVRTKARFAEAPLLAFDYGATASEVAGRGVGWLRAFRSHGSDTAWLATPGLYDITTDVVLEQVDAALSISHVETQSEFLRRHGIEDLVEEGKQVWAGSGHIADLAAVKARSRIREAESLLDPAGMGGFLALYWRAG
ncbi:MAG: SAM-dependent methyltransferase [Acidimicrobiales bacterium]|nr:SAM-dependent methyltransferase [Acidimicrobiales bacterium]